MEVFCLIDSPYRENSVRYVSSLHKSKKMIYKNVKPTVYKGVHFRSQLEARWAVFFDLRSIEWEYEPRMFDLKTGGYIPDFKVNGVYAEVKPKVAPEPIWLSKLEELRGVTGMPVLLLLGGPDFYLHRAYLSRWTSVQLFDRGFLISYSTSDLSLENTMVKFMFSDDYQLDINRTRNYKFHGQ